MNVQRTIILNPITNRLHTIVLYYRLGSNDKDQMNLTLFY